MDTPDGLTSIAANGRCPANTADPAASTHWARKALEDSDGRCPSFIPLTPDVFPAADPRDSTKTDSPARAIVVSLSADSGDNRADAPAERPPNRFIVTVGRCFRCLLFGCCSNRRRH
ncbi:Hypothetical protein CINCED_3A009139 [Cinara cedri]|uniref:Uncharacterized protein n=1 Tax=Cinara cedri TaxID=506608 RepID=A0A5E4N3D4_9HEMI|nr:Hypothetical protein CINCED_3A009139 [Cinara cedri]